MLGLINGFARPMYEKAVGRLPQLRVSAMDCLIPGFNFVVTLNEITYGFQSVSGLSINRKVNYMSEGGVNDHQIMVGCPNDDTPTLTFKRGILMRSSDSVDTNALAAASLIPDNAARKLAVTAAVSVDPQACLEKGPALGTISVYDRSKRIRAVYTFISLGITSWRSDDLDASSSGILCEEFTVAHTGLERMAIDSPPIIGAVKNAYSDTTSLANSYSPTNKLQQAKKRETLSKNLNRQEQEKEVLVGRHVSETRDLHEEEKILKRLEEQSRKAQA